MFAGSAHYVLHGTTCEHVIKLSFFPIAILNIDARIHTFCGRGSWEPEMGEREQNHTASRWQSPKQNQVCLIPKLF